MTRYIAILCKDTNSSFGLHFPDLPGCITAGDTEDEAFANASVALRLWLEDAEDVPPPSSFDELRKRPDVQQDLAEGGVAVLIPVIFAGRKQRLNIMLDPGIVEAADRAARAAGVSRSLYIEQALGNSLAKDVGAVRVKDRPPRSRTRGKAGS